MSCRYDREAKAHLLRQHRDECTTVTCDGCVPCTHDDNGNPLRHCRTRNRCTSHLHNGEYVCPTCLSKIRTNLTRVLVAEAAMPAEVQEVGRIDRTAAFNHLATAHPESWRRRMMHNAEHGGYTEDPDEHDPWQMLALRERMIREDMGHDDRRLVSSTLAETCAYLGWALTDLARREDQTLVVAELLDETRRLADAGEAVLHDSRAPERGAPCRSCPAPAPRLQLEHGHFCTDPDCQQANHEDDTADRWVCPRDRDHWWDMADYRRWVYADAKAERAS